MGSNDSKLGDHMLITGIVIGAVAVVTWVAVPLFYSVAFLRAFRARIVRGAGVRGAADVQCRSRKYAV